MFQLAAILVFGIPLWVVIVYLVLTGLNAQMEHANVRMNGNLGRFLQLVVGTPHMHKVHHSRDQRETDSDYSNIFSFWDGDFGLWWFLKSPAPVFIDS